MSRIGVVTVTYNSATVLPEFLASVWNQTHADFLLYVIDSGSTDSTAEQLAGITDPRARIVLTGRNVGFAAGCNAGIRLALEQGCESILLLNNDTVFPEDLFQRLHDGLEKYRCDMTTPKMLYHSDPGRIWAAGGRLNKWLSYRNTHDGANQPDGGRFNRARQVTFTPFCCVLMRSSVIERIGYLDENYFVYTEDADYCFRAMKAGLSLWYLPDAKLLHKVSSLTGGAEMPFLIRHCTRNRVYFVRKHLGRWASKAWCLAYFGYFWSRHKLGKDSERFWLLKSRAFQEGRQNRSCIPTAQDGPLSVYVHLSYGQGAQGWKGPDRVPYGYHHAEPFGCTLTYSHDYKESRAVQLVRRALRRFLGADIVHAYRNRQAIRECDVVWTHTEHESLAVLALLRLFPRGTTPPRVIAQSVHLFDLWLQLPRWKRSIYKRLLGSADILSVHSDENLKICRRIFPSNDCRLVKFGISIDDFPMTEPHFDPDPSAIKLLSLGNDMHRDWDILCMALKNRTDTFLRVAVPDPKKRRIKHRFAGLTNSTLISAKSLRELRDLYSWADVIVVPLLPNSHVSGITVILEAITQGKPVVAADTGGLNAYFSKNEVFYYQAGNVHSLSATLAACISDRSNTVATILAAQRRIVQDELTSEGFAKRHAVITRELTTGRSHPLGYPELTRTSAEE